MSILPIKKEPIQRQVALKIMRHGLSTAADEARFDAERRSLARLSHPNIAQMFEAGSTEDGKLFFAMELVQGMPITRYCDSRSLSILGTSAYFHGCFARGAARAPTPTAAQGPEAFQYPGDRA